MLVTTRLPGDRICFGREGSDQQILLRIDCFTTLDDGRDAIVLVVDAPQEVTIDVLKPGRSKRVVGLAADGDRGERRPGRLREIPVGEPPGSLARQKGPLAGKGGL